MTTQSPSKTSSVDFNTPAMQRHRAMRHFKDHFTRWYVAVGGLGVIVAVLLIFLYLLYEVLPLFGGAEIEERERYSASWVQADDPPLMLAMEEQGEVAIRVARSGQVSFFNARDGKAVLQQQLPIPAGAQVIINDKQICTEGADTCETSVAPGSYLVKMQKSRYRQ